MSGTDELQQGIELDGIGGSDGSGHGATLRCTDSGDEKFSAITFSTSASVAHAQFGHRGTHDPRARRRSRNHRRGTFGIPADHVTIVVRDIDTTSWGIRGGQAACDVELGFDVNV